MYSSLQALALVSMLRTRWQHWSVCGLLFGITACVHGWMVAGGLSFELLCAVIGHLCLCCIHYDTSNSQHCVPHLTLHNVFNHDSSLCSMHNSAVSNSQHCVPHLTLHNVFNHDSSLCSMHNSAVASCM